MHADIHLQLHALTAAEAHRTAELRFTREESASPSLRVQLGWRLVELGLRLATPADRPVTLAA
ncbi:MULTISPECIES: hypothetical protein [unclassified Streptomyces]|uniref:hypothetical protein n=1 Tax=unclassified Streptomyces TaxID=2593676 RepID=UPI0006B03DEF|nr:MULTISPECIES: hypothetical protein [unclassified Streptomyces]KOX19323.1 hypothetical protein ADL06_29775 [Streptomyces sp. NRRL F-6491]KOX37549.1 hypothetical protein ADL08_29880 [Streptomyces sp. NRRL F-6492]